MEKHPGIKESLALNFRMYVGLLAIGVFAFSPALKNVVRREQGGLCDDCGVRPKKLYIHHKVPQSMGGSDKRENAIGLCNGEDNRCHDYWDQQALENGIIYPGIPLSEVPPILFKEVKE